MEKKLFLVVSEEANLEGAGAVYVELLKAMELMEVPHPQQDKVMQHVQACLQELDKDRMDGEIETKEEVVQLVVTLPSMEDHLENGTSRRSCTLIRRQLLNKEIL